MKGIKGTTDAMGLSDDERELILHLLEEDGVETSEMQAISPRQDIDELPLSSAQERLWFLEQLVPGTPTYHIPEALRLEGRLNVAALERSLNEMVRRHESLRTTFQARGGRPAQIISPPAALSLPVVDLRDIAEGEKKSRSLALASQEMRRPFDLVTGPLFRASLLKLADDEHIFLLTMHHIISDGWSMQVFIREMLLLYEAFDAGRPSPLPDLVIQYADYTLWERQFLQSDSLRAQQQYWKQQLRDLSVLDLPTDRPRPPVQTFRGAIKLFELPVALSSALQEMNSQENTTLFMALLSAFAAALHRCSNQDDIAVGTPSANRNRPNTEELIGLFINTLVLRIDFSDTPTYRELLNRVRQVTLDAFDHPDLPFDRLVETLQPKRDLSRGALRQVVFAMQNLLNEPVALSELSISPLVAEADIGVARLDMALFMWEGPGRIMGALEYNTDLFDASTIERFIGFLRAMLDDMALDAGRPIRMLPPLVEKKQASLESPLPAAAKETRPKPGDEESNLAENQLLFWFSKKLQPDVQLYFDYVIATFTINGAIDPEHFQRAFQKLIDHSDVLRSAIAEIDGSPRRIVHDAVSYEVEFQDFSALSDADGALRNWFEERSRKLPDFRSRLFDCALVKLAENRFAWYLNINHIISDLWSVSVIAKKVSEYYRLSMESNLDSAEPMPAYQGYIEQERAHRQSEAYRKSEAYWSKKLADTPSLSQFYRSDFSAQTTATRRVCYEMGAQRSLRLKEAADRAGFFSPAVFFATTLFAYQRRITGEQTLRLGSPFANRPEAFKQTIGLFINVCPLQVTVADGDTFLSLARKVQMEIIDTVRNQSYPVRNPLDNRAYNVYFNYQNAAFTEFCGMGLEFNLFHSGHSNDTMTLQVRDFSASGNFVLDFDFNSAAFNEQQAQQTVDHFLNLLDCFLEDQKKPLLAARLLSNQEQAQLLSEFNATAKAYRRGVCLHELIEEQVERAPAAAALVYEDRSLSYSELNERANQLAHHLRSLGVGPDARVGICVERAIEMVVGLLGILKAGGAYVPLDPTYPMERLAFMLEDAKVPVLLTQEKLLAQTSEHGAKVVCLDSDWSEIASAPRHNPSLLTTEDNLAYVIYTSGSTGKPKGAMIQHSGICNRLFWMQEAYGLDASDRVLQKTPFSFDVSVWEFFWPLITGARLVMARPAGHQDRAYLVEEIEKQQITTIHFVPSMLQVFLAGDGLERCASLKRVVCSGEALPYELQQRFFESMSADLFNLYGPTEASVDVTHWSCERDIDLRIVPIGRPIANIQIHLLDRHLDLVPAGIAGELHIGGIGLARGYLGRPDLTAEKFVPNPFSDEPGARLYKTGDLARHLPDGNIEYLGRIDHQVKIRGFRIELGEIEEALCEHQAIREAVLLAREDRPGDKRLVAYIVFAAGQSAQPSELRGFLKERLPEYMAPQAFVSLDELPLTPNGKVNRKALPAPDQTHLGSEESFVAPRSPLEQLIAETWAEVLGLERVGIHDDFFELGGQSLLATQLIYKLQQVLPVEIALRSVFEAPTVAKLAEVVSEAQGSQDQEEQMMLEQMLAELEQLSEDQDSQR